MKKAYWILRGVGYVGNLVGIALFVIGRRNGATSLIATGGGLIVVGFAAFVASYAVYLAVKLRQPR